MKIYGEKNNWKIWTTGDSARSFRITWFWDHSTGPPIQFRIHIVYLAKFCQTYYNQFKNDSLLATDSIRAQELKTVSKCLASFKSLCLASAQASGDEIADFHIITSHHQRLQIHNIKFPNGWAAPNSGNSTQAPPPSHKRLALVSGFFYLYSNIYIWPHFMKWFHKKIFYFMKDGFPYQLFPTNWAGGITSSWSLETDQLVMTSYFQCQTNWFQFCVISLQNR